MVGRGRLAYPTGILPSLEGQPYSLFFLHHQARQHQDDLLPDLHVPRKTLIGFEVPSKRRYGLFRLERPYGIGKRNMPPQRARTAPQNRSSKDCCNGLG